MTKLYDVTDWPKRGIDERNYPFVGTVDAELAIGRVLEIDGCSFSVEIRSLNGEAAGVKLMGGELNTEPKGSGYENNIVCPYCGYVDQGSFERSDEDTVECQRCGGTIHYQRIVTVEYLTDPVRPPEPIKAQWVKDT